MTTPYTYATDVIAAAVNLWDSGSRPPLSPAQKAAAALVCAGYATDVEDLRFLLWQLGLL